MKSKFFFLLILFAAATANLAAQKKEYVGYEHKGVIYGATLPNGAKDLGGGLLSNQNYGVTRFSKGKQFMLWLEKIISRDASGIPSWRVKDVLTFPEPKKNEEFLLSYSSGCRQNGRENLNLIVRAEFISKTKIYKIINAWRANVEKEQFEVIPIKGIVCRYEPPEQ